MPEPDRAIRLRGGVRIADEAQLLLRYGDDHDRETALRNALRDSHLYRVLPDYERGGAVTVSTFVVDDEREAELFTRGFDKPAYGLSTAGRLRRAGYVLLATDILTDGVPAPLSERHVDVVVMAYPADDPPYATLGSAQRGRVRERLIEAYRRALGEFDPRQVLRGEGR